MFALTIRYIFHAFNYISVFRMVIEIYVVLFVLPVDANILSKVACFYAYAYTMSQL